MQLSGVPFTSVPVFDLLVGDIAAHQSAPYRSVVLSQVDLYNSSLGGIKVGALPDKSAVVSCSNCDNKNLYEVRSSIVPTAAIADLGSAIAGITIGRLVTGLLRSGIRDFGAVSLASAGVVHYAAGPGVKTFHVPYTVSFVNGDASPLPSGSTVSVKLPRTFAYIPGSTTATIRGLTVTTDAPTFDGSTVTWAINGSVGTGDEFVLRFNARPGTFLGTFTVDRVEVAGASTSVEVTTPQAPVNVVDPADRTDTSPARSNDTVDTATTIIPSTPTQVGNMAIGFISSATDRDLYTFAADGIAEGSLIVAQVEQQQSGDADLSVFGAAGMTGVAPLRPVANPTATELLTDTHPAMSGSRTNLATDAQADIPVLPGRPLLGVSRYAGTADELVTFIAPGGATPGSKYVLQVTGYRGEAVLTPHSVRVQVVPPAITSTAPARFADPQPTNTNLLPGASTLEETKNLYLHAPGRLAKVHGTAADQVTSALNQLVADETLRNRFGKSAILEVDATSINGAPNPVNAAFAAWDANPGDPALANNVVRAINMLVDTYRQSAGLSLSSIVIVGGDNIIPQARLADLTIKVNERDFASTLAGATTESNELTNAAALGYFLSDDPFSSFAPVANTGGQFLYMPSVMSGRLIESATDIAGTMNRFRTFGGIAAASTSLTTSATDFLDDMAAAVNDALEGTATTRTARINSNWTAADYASGFVNNDIVSFNGHSDPYRTETRATRSNGEVFSTPAFLDGPNLDRNGSTVGGVAFSVGCHTGQLVTDGLVTAGSASEWAQAAAQKRAGGFVGQTGYGIGSSAGIVMTEKLMLNFAKNIGTYSMGRSLMEAKLRFIGEAGPLSVFHTKSVMQATYYGIPSLRLPGASDAAPPLANPSTSTDPVTGLTVATIARQATDPGQPGFYSLNRHDGPDGSYWDASGGTLATPERPILPMVSVDVSAAGLQATGVLVTDLTSVDLADINPVMPAVTTTGGGVSQTELQAENIAVPASLQYLGKGAAGHDTVNLVTGMFNQSMLVNGKTVGRQRLFTDIKAMTFYAPAGSSNAAPATIISARSALVNGLVTFTIEAEPQGSDTVKQALILFKEPGTPKWKSVSLLKGAGRSWAGAAAATGNEVEYFVQTVTDKGKVSVLANKARLLLSQAAPPPIGHVVTNITGSPAPDFAPNADGNFGAFFKTAAVTLVPTSPETIVGYGVNGPINRVATGPIYFEGSSSPAVQPGAIRGDGLHTINYRATDGSTGTLTVRIDSGGPDITLTSPTAGARYPLHGAATLGFACTDSGSGVKAINGSPACTATVDGQPVTNGGALPTGAAGLHVMVVNSADNAGFTTTKTLTYSVGYVFEGFFSPIVEGDSYEAQAGDNIPFKWRLTDANGNQITHLSAVTSFASYRYTCSSPTPSPTPPPGSTEPDGLKHDGDQYHYNWKTAKGLPPAGYAGTCRRVVLTFDDTTQQTVNVSFK